MTPEFAEWIAVGMVLMGILDRTFIPWAARRLTRPSYRLHRPIRVRVDDR